MGTFKIITKKALIKDIGRFIKNNFNSTAKFYALSRKGNDLGDKSTK